MEGRLFAPALTPSQMASLLLFKQQRSLQRPEPRKTPPAAPSGLLGAHDGTAGATSRIADACGFVLAPHRAYHSALTSASAVAISPHALPTCLPALASLDMLELSSVDDSGVEQAMELTSPLCSGVARAARVAVLAEGSLSPDVVRHLVVGHEFVHLDAAAPLQAARGAIAALAPALAETILCAAAAEGALCAATAESDSDAAISNLLAARLFRAKDACVVVTGLSAVAAGELARVASTVGMRAIRLPHAHRVHPSAYEAALRAIEPVIQDCGSGGCK